MATRWDNVPDMSEDVVRRTREDIDKYKKGRDVDSSNLKGGAKESVREAGTRARNRMIGRAGLAQAALTAGDMIGTEIEKRTGIGKKFVDESGLGDAVYRRTLRGLDRVKLTPDAETRVLEGETEGGMKRGGKVTASSRADGIAQRGKTRGKMVMCGGGRVKK